MVWAPKDYKIGICRFSVKQAAFRSKSKDWFVRYHYDVSEWSNMSTYGILFLWDSIIKIQLSMLV